jgi:uncharacterized RDD family membrane protein YckC
MNAIDRYVEDVMHRIGPGIPGRSRIESDLRSHLTERTTAGEDAGSAVDRMGPASEVARGFLEAVELPIAGRADRLGGFLFDVGFGFVGMAAISLAVVAVLGPHLQGELTPPMAVALGICGALVFVTVFLYFPVLEGLFGQTAGKRAFGTHVVRDTGERIGFWTAVIRRLPFAFDIWPLDAAFLLFTARRQRAFDFAAHTVVIGGGRRIGHPWALTALLWAMAIGLGALTALVGGG